MIIIGKGAVRRAGRLLSVFALAVLASFLSAGVYGEPKSLAEAAIPRSRATLGGVIHVSKKIPDAYIVVLKAEANAETASVDLVARYGGHLKQIYRAALNGFSIDMNETQAENMAADPEVKYIEEDQIATADKVRPDTVQTGATWGLDRIDQRNLPLSGTYSYAVTASNVHAYIVDTGILITHTQFAGRATIGVDEIGDGQNGIDCAGHGTHVAGTVGGSTYGVAKNVSLVAVRVLNCSGSGTFSQVIAGVNWVAQNAIKPAVANMSLGGGASQSLDDAVAGAVSAGIVFCVAAGNGDSFGNALDACTTSPARAPTAITVSATDISDTKPTWANIGTCVDIFAPGVNITSSWYSSTVATNTISGTSMATPHVAGASALYLSGHPTATPAAVAAALTGNATTGVVIGPGSGSPNRFLYTGFITSGGAALYLVPACRLLDTRNPTGPLGGPSLAAGAIRNVSVVGVCGVPSGAAALATNITAIAPFSSGWLTLYGGPLSSSRPFASTLNYVTAKTGANNAVIPVGSDGTINIYNSGPSSVGFIVDISGYFK